MVVVPDGGVAERRATAAVAQVDEVGQGVAEELEADSMAMSAPVAGMAKRRWMVERVCSAPVAASRRDNDAGR